MRFEIIEQAGAWVVRSEETELARFDSQAKALEDVAVRMRQADRSKPASLVVRYEQRET
jgi:hypothetical protein